MPTVNVVFGKSKAPAKFYYRGKRISVDTAFGMYQRKAGFVVGGKPLRFPSSSRFGATTIGDIPAELIRSIAESSSVNDASKLARVDKFTAQTVDKPVLRGIDHRAKENAIRKLTPEQRAGIQEQDAHTIDDYVVGDWKNAQITPGMELTEIPGISEGGVKLLGVNVIGLIGQFMMFKETGDTPDALKRKFNAWLKSKHINTHRDIITEAVADKIETFMPGMFE